MIFVKPTLLLKICSYAFEKASALKIVLEFLNGFVGLRIKKSKFSFKFSKYILHSNIELDKEMFFGLRSRTSAP